VTPVPEFVVILRASLYGSSAFTTEDVVEAADAASAEAKAIAAWRNVEPLYDFAPLLTTVSSPSASA
jgi:hypothetical protein